MQVRDADGRVYLDCLAGAGALALGHAHPVVVGALRAALDSGVPLTTLDLATPLRDAFVETLFAVLPPSLRGGKIQFCGPTGADAVEAAVKLARTATGRSGAIAFGGAYHGMTQGALALSGAHAPKAALGALGADVQHLPFPSSYRCPFGEGGERGAELCARALRWALSDTHSGILPPAAILVEPVQGEGGVHPAPPAFAAARAGGGVGGRRRARRRRGPDRAGADRDAVGLGRPRPGSRRARALQGDRRWPAAGGDRLPRRARRLGAGRPRRDVSRQPARPRRRRGDDPPRRRARPRAHAGAMGARLVELLREQTDGLAVVAEVRGRGLMVGVELVDPRRCDHDGVPRPDGALAGAVQRAMLELGVLVEIGGRDGAVVRFLPPLIVAPEQIERIATAFGSAVRSAAARAR